MSEEELIERLAAHCHDEQWSGWMGYLYSKCERSYDGEGLPALTIPNRTMRIWNAQMHTSYSELPEASKESDRQQARAILAVLREES